MLHTLDLLAFAGANVSSGEPNGTQSTTETDKGSAGAPVPAVGVSGPPSEAPADTKPAAEVRRLTYNMHVSAHAMCHEWCPHHACVESRRYCMFILLAHACTPSVVRACVFWDVSQDEKVHGLSEGIFKVTDGRYGAAVFNTQYFVIKNAVSEAKDLYGATKALLNGLDG